MRLCDDSGTPENGPVIVGYVGDTLVQLSNVEAALQNQIDATILSLAAHIAALEVDPAESDVLDRMAMCSLEFVAINPHYLCPMIELLKKIGCLVAGGSVDVATRKDGSKQVVIQDPTGKEPKVEKDPQVPPSGGGLFEKG